MVQRRLFATPLHIAYHPFDLPGQPLAVMP